MARLSGQPGDPVLSPDLAIGVFDSGVGGLTVLDECLAQLPAEDFIYFGDTAWFPYGDRTDEQLRARAEDISGWLIARGVKTIVIACNTATAAALTHLQTHLDIPVIGVMSSEAHAAVQTTRNRRVGLLATEATVRSGSYERMIHAHDAGVELVSVACPRLAPAIQAGDPFDDRIVDMVREYTAPLRVADVDTVILGCTHYPLVERLLRRNLPNTRLIKSGEELARELRESLERKSLLRATAVEGRYRFACSGDPEAFHALGTRFLQMPLGAVEQVTIGA
jgi:glutamate racemase